MIAMFLHSLGPLDIVTDRKNARKKDWGCIELTDSGLRVKPGEEAHMKTQLRKPARERVSYSDQYKREALELWRASGRSAAKIGAELGIRAALLYRWARLAREPGSPSAHQPKRSLEELELEIRRLRAENAKLLEQREVLKKSLSILSEVPPSGMPGSSK